MNLQKKTVGLYIFIFIFILAWSSPKPVDSGPATVVGSDPWGGNFGSSDATVSGWADFNSAPFEANFTNFDDSFNKGVGSKGNKQSVVESDLKLENIDSQTDNSKDTKSNSIDKVAQVEDDKSEGPDTIKSAAGDQGGQVVLEHQKTSSTAVTEPSK